MLSVLAMFGRSVLESFASIADNQKHCLGTFLTHKKTKTVLTLFMAFDLSMTRDLELKRKILSRL